MDILETARWVADGRLAPWAVSDESVVEMARQLLEATGARQPTLTMAALEAWAEIARNTEREACERVALQCVDEFGSHAGEIAARIRARGGK